VKEKKCREKRREENKGLKTWNDENILGKTRFVKRLK
jgi:hypothetical protein